MGIFIVGLLKKLRVCLIEIPYQERTDVKAMPGKPYDGHTLATVIPEMEALIGNTIERVIADKGYRGHNAPPDYKFRVFITG